MFRNVRFLRFNGPWPSDESALDESLNKAIFRPCGPLTEKSAGWEAPVDAGGQRLCRSVAGADLLQLRVQSRLLPASAINEAVEQRIDEFRTRTGDTPGRREKRRLKLETRDNLLPKALLRSERIRGLFIRSDNILAIDAGSPVKLESFIETLRLALGRFEATPLEFRQPPARMLPKVFLGEGPPGITLGRECVMQDPADSKAKVRFADMDLTDANIRKHVRDGMKLTQLGMGFNGMMSFVLDENGGLGKLRLAEADAPDTGADEDPLARFDAEFVLLSGTLREYLRLVL